MSESAPVLYIVDDDASFLLALSRLLRAAGYVVKAFSSARELLAQLAETPGCVIADMHMPDFSGLELQEALARAGHTLPVIFLTGHVDIPTTVRAMRQGAEDFLTKGAPKEHLLEAVRGALARDGRQRAERVRLHELRSRLDALTPRERDVLQHVVHGRLNKQIAADLCINERTVKLHRTAVTTKLQVRSVAELTLLVHVAGVFEERLPNFPKG
jgi:FixJ family two-component response regulator